MTVTVDEVKEYLRVDGDDEDELIAQLILTAEQFCQDTLRADELNESAANKLAVMYAVSYLYEHREDADYHSLMLMLRSLLFGERREAF